MSTPPFFTIYATPPIFAIYYVNAPIFTIDHAPRFPIRINAIFVLHSVKAVGFVFSSGST